MSRTSFTVAVPTHNRRETVVLSVRSALAQTLAPERVIVLCDGCTDGTASALAEIGDERVVAIELEKGPGYAYDHRNRALEQAGTDFIVYAGDDDLLLPDHLAQLNEQSDGADLVCSPAVIVDPDDSLTWIGANWSVPEARARMEGLANSNVMASVAIRVRFASKIGGWDGAIERAADWELWRRATRAGAVAAATEAPTVLHFKATGREQAWQDRVAQNSRWLALLEDPHRLAELRPRLAKARYELEARQAVETDLLRETLHEYGTELARLHRLHAEKDQQIAELDRGLTDALELAEQRREWIDNSEQLLASRQQHIDAAEAELAYLRDQLAGHLVRRRLRRRR
jgi:glycosyltransferase involved in cell wall biosynthesis